MKKRNYLNQIKVNAFGYVTITSLIRWYGVISQTFRKRTLREKVLYKTFSNLSPNSLEDALISAIQAVCIYFTYALVLCHEFIMYQPEGEGQNLLALQCWYIQ